MLTQKLPTDEHYSISQMWRKLLEMQKNKGRNPKNMQVQFSTKCSRENKSRLSKLHKEKWDKMYGYKDFTKKRTIVSMAQSSEQTNATYS